MRTIMDMRAVAAVLGCSLLAACARPVDAREAAAPVAPLAVHPEPPPPEPSQDDAFLGVVLASEAVELSAPFDGQLERIGVQPGDRVKAGTVVGSMALESLRSQERMEQALLEQAEAERHRAELEVEAAAERRQRYEKPPPGTLSADELAAAQYDEKLARAQVAAARARIRERQAALAGIRQRLVEAEIRAPFDCIVAVRHLDPGARIQAGMPVLRLIRAGGFRVRFALPEARSGTATTGLPVDVFLPALGRALPGRIDSLAPEVDPASRMVFGLATLLSSHDAVRAGMVARVSLGGGLSPPPPSSAGGPPGKSSGE